MATIIADNASRILAFLYEGAPNHQLSGQELADTLRMTPQAVNDAVSILEENSYVEWQQFLGTAPFRFGVVEITSRGRYEYERAEKAPANANAPTSSGSVTLQIAPPPAPVGSPFGFVDADWEIVAERRGARDQLNVVLGFQFKSAYYDSGPLVANIEAMFGRALKAYSALPAAVPAALSFRQLSAGYGEHLFNEIARDIISADIAVFETSDLNPNVMLELGVALTWGVRVFVIKKEGCDKPPSDLSGQTWADHRDSAAAFPDPAHDEKLVRMVERAIRKKARP